MTASIATISLKRKPYPEQTHQRRLPSPLLAVKQEKERAKARESRRKVAQEQDADQVARLTLLATSSTSVKVDV